MSSELPASDQILAAPPCVVPPTDHARWFAEEVQPLTDSARGFVRRRFPSLDVDDVLQESFIHLLKAKAKGRVDSTKAYFFTICRNTAIRFLRRPKHYSEIPLVESPGLRVYAEGPDAADSADVQLRQELMIEAISRLPNRCQAILRRAYFEGKSHEEIAAELGLAVNTVRAQIGFGIKKCAEFLRTKGERR